MAAKERLAFQLLSLEIPQATNEKVQLLQDILKTLTPIINVNDQLIKSNLLPSIARVLEDNYTQWKTAWPDWVNVLMERAKQCVNTVQHYPTDQVVLLLAAFRKYIVSECWEAMRGFSVVAIFNDAKRILLNDYEIYNIVTKRIDDCYTLSFLYNVTYSEDWQLKLLSDEKLINRLLSLPNEDENVWNILISIAKHPDAKILLNKEAVIAKAGKSKYIRCVDLCALICSESDLSSFELDDDWIDNIAYLLQSIITRGLAQSGDHTLGLLDLILPIANVSVLDSQKEALGKQVIPLLMRVVTEDLPDRFTITPFLTRGRQEATRALWNFAYSSANRELIAKDGGIAILETKMVTMYDPLIASNIAGILHMFSSPPESIRASTSENERSSSGHVMLSYNWRHQRIAKRLAASLQERGYRVWIDVEQMQGSTLEAMASAIEQSSLVLMCMSQRYADSPNCRLEGEYCVKRGVNFIPLMMQRRFQPDGWLGITLGAKLYYDFTDEENWDAKIDNLVKALAIGERGKEITNGKPIVTTNGKSSVRATASPSIQTSDPLDSWTDADIEKWLRKEGLERFHTQFKAHKFTGKALAELKRLHTIRNPTFIFKFCQQFGFGITDLGEILELSAAIHRL